MFKGTRKYWFIALLFGLAAAALFYQYLQQISDRPENMIKVLVAGENIKKDSLVTSRQLKIVEMPSRYVNGICLHSKPQAEGKVAITDIAAGEEILPQKLLSPGNNNKLSYSVPVSRRAVAVSVDAVSGVAGNIRVGDRVDVIGTLEVNPAGTQAPVVCSIFTLQDVPVLAASNITGSSMKNGDTKSTVVLSVAADQVQRLVLVSEKGSIRLVLRSPLDKSQVALPPLQMENLLQ